MLALNLSPFLNKAVTLAYFQSLCTSPSSIVFLKINVMNGVNSDDRSFKIHDVIKSGPQALFGFVFCNNFLTPSSLTLMFGIDG